MSGRRGTWISETVESRAGWEKRMTNGWMDELAQKQTIFILPFVVVFFVSLEKMFVRGSILGT